MSTIARALEKQRRDQAEAAGAMPLDAESPEQAVLKPTERLPHPHSRPQHAPHRSPSRQPAGSAGQGVRPAPIALAMMLLVVAVGVGYFAGSGNQSPQRGDDSSQRAQTAASQAVPAATNAPEQTPMVVRVEVAVKQETPVPAPESPPVQHVLEELPLPVAPVEMQPQVAADIPVEPPMGVMPPMEDYVPEAEPAPARSRRSRARATTDLRLEGIFWSEKDPMAIINDDIVGVGRVVNGAKILRIDKTTVVVEIDGDEITLR